MKKLKRPLFFLSFLLLFVATQCNEDDFPVPSCEERLEELAILNEEIQTLINTSQCSDVFECRAIAFGSKPCGGPWEYLVYTTSIDTLLLQNLVNQYNATEETYNLNCDAVSDCAFVVPPIGFECEEGECIPVF